MSLSRSPSPRPQGGWTSKGLTDRISPLNGFSTNMNGYTNDNDDQWAAAKAKSEQVRGYPSIQTKNEGFFQRSRRRISSTLPSFNRYSPKSPNWRESEKLGRGRWQPRGGGNIAKIKTFAGNVLRRFKFLLIILSIVVLTTLIMSETDMRTRFRSSRLGGGGKFVIILAANEGGGVMEWKGPREWAIERDSVKNKRKYAERWGYHLEIADMSTKKRYAHEWRESWEKVDIVRNCMAKYPKAEWFWWLDLTTFIMEPSVSLQSHIFNDLESTTYRDINYYNPLNISHPPSAEFLDPFSSSAKGDGRPESIDLIIPQDCNGFNLGSFFVHRSSWTDRLLDIWWDPVLYEQKHMDWEHKEQDALEHLYTSQPYLRSHVAFIEQRRINSFPPDACAVPKLANDGSENSSDDDNDDEIVLLDSRFHYDEDERDFIVNMAGCEWGRDCWAEMYRYRELSYRLNRSWWEKFKDFWSDWFKRIKQDWKGTTSVKAREGEKKSRKHE